MKVKWVVILVILLNGAVLSGQQMPTLWFSGIPSIPVNLCVVGDDPQREAFADKMVEIQDSIGEVLARMSRDGEAKFAGKEEEMAANMMKQAGMTQADIAKMQAMAQASKGSDKAQKEKMKQEMADQMLQQTINMSMDEVNQLKQMDTNARKAWATAYATEKKAEVMADPEGAQKQLEERQNLNDLLMERQKLRDSLSACQEKFFKKEMEIENDSSRHRVLAEIAKRKVRINELNRENPVPINDIRSIRTEIRNMQESYCSIYSARYRTILTEYEVFTRTSLDAYARLEALENQVVLAQTGVDPETDAGLFGLGQVKAYMDKLSRVYQYNIIDPLLFPEEMGVGK
jgi:hypothetical protein